MTVIADLKKNLQACKDELPEMRKLLAKLEELCGMAEERGMKRNLSVFLRFFYYYWLNDSFQLLKVNGRSIS